MAETIAIAFGRGKNSEAQSSRLGTEESEARANTHRTFTTSVIQKDGSARVSIEREFGGEGRRTLVVIDINSEAEFKPQITLQFDRDFRSRECELRNGQRVEIWTPSTPDQQSDDGEPFD
jgi:hypothetical protein